MPSGRGDGGTKNQKKKSKEQLAKEAKRQATVRPIEPMTFEVVKPKRKERP